MGSLKFGFDGELLLFVCGGGVMVTQFNFFHKGFKAS